MISALDAPPLPPVILTLLAASGVAGAAAVCRTLAVTSGASLLRRAGKISTFAIANGSPLTGKSRRGSITRTMAIAKIAAPTAAPLVGRFRPSGGVEEAVPTKPSGSSSSSHTAVDTLARNVSESRINLVPAYSRFVRPRSAPLMPRHAARVFRLIFSPDTSLVTAFVTRPKKHFRWPAI